MEKIMDVSFIRFRNAEHFQFMTDLRDQITAATPAALNLEEVFTRFNEAYNTLDRALRVDAGSVKTELVVAADIRRDNTWSALNTAVNAMLLSPVQDQVEAAKAIERVFDLYGNVRQLSYNEETALLTNLIVDLEKPENAAYCATMGISPWVAALKTQNADFQTLLNERNREYANKDSGDVKAARIVIDPVYYEIATRLNAMVTLGVASDEAKELIKELNQKIKYYKSTIDSRGSRNDDGDGEEDEPPVPPQED